jgi:peroxiredoxin Q/BCP
MALKTGNKVPALSLKDKEGNSFRLDQFEGKKCFVIYFYPKNFTPGCTKEACAFRDRYQDFKEAGAEVIAISSDSEISHNKVSKKDNLPFIFLSAPEKEARKSFGVQSSLLGLIPGRETFVFDKSGRLRMRYNSMDASQHTDRALDEVRQINRQETA